MRAEGRDPLACPAVAMACQQAVSVEDAGNQIVRDAIAALVKQTGSIEAAAGKLGISDLNPDSADHEF